MDVKQPLYQLFKVVSRDRLLQPSCFAKNYKKVSLVGGENKVRKLVIPEGDIVLVKAINYVGMINNAINLLLIFRFVNFSLLSLVKLY